jgi:low temperature requirement protein LtrA
MDAIEQVAEGTEAAVALPEPLAERRTASIELLWDLVFVFAVTQVTAMLAMRITWGRFGRAMLVLALSGHGSRCGWWRRCSITRGRRS